MSSLADLANANELKAGSRAFATWIACKALSGSLREAADAFRQRHTGAQYVREVDQMVRAAVPGGMTDNPTWAGALVSPELAFAGPFTEVLRGQTVLGRLAYVPAPLRVRVPTATSGTKARWVGQGRAVPVQHMAYTTASLEPGKIGVILTLTRELAQSSDPAATSLFEADLRAGLIEGTDLALLDPAAAATPDGPASITNSCWTIPSSGGDAAAVENDILKLFAHLAEAKVPLRAPALIASQMGGLHLAGLRTTSGERAFPDATALGGSVLGVPLITSASTGDQIVLIDAAYLLVGDGGLEVTSSQAGAIEMDDAPTSAISPPAAATGPLLGLWQANVLAMKGIRFLSWMLAQPDACARISGFNYAPGGVTP